MTTINLILNGNIPSKKNSRINFCRGNRPISIPSNEYRKWHEEQSWQIARHRPKEPIKKCKIEFVYWVATKRKADLDNKNSSILDLLVDCQFIEDENYFVVVEENSKLAGIDKVNPRCEIKINIL
jgi:Holliday junction resolvase RusA-like endonuclease